MSNVSVESSLCQYCTNVRLKIKVLNQLLGSSAELPPETKLLNVLCCLPEEGERWQSMNCVLEKCDKCIHRMRIFEAFCMDIMDTAATWSHWERNGDNKHEPIVKNGTVRDLLKELKDDIVWPKQPKSSFVLHLYTAYWQHWQYKDNRRNPEDGELVMVQDFGENRKTSYAMEIKSAHFGKTQITVHPIVCSYRCGDSVVREAHIFMTDDIKHDHNAVNEFTKQSLSMISTKITVKRLTMWSDGAVSQYKNKSTLHDMTMLFHKAQRCYFGSDHGKGESDGETGFLSQVLRRAVYTGKIFRNAKDMVDYLSEKHGTALSEVASLFHTS
ncbi:uncharacterized protein LOC130908437 [Corythoichthys intestinalis]|uniref:uncharacterized protein LOC130908437 n=1 Tax=Corythoichthys intestinalis TaxID=161448 RepID=UPI0025A596AF|nr:uncharacterized protein LOC130908437 [Corythoichthys intestinalis]